MCIKGTLIAKLKPGFGVFFFKCYLCIHFKKWVKSQREFSITFKKNSRSFPTNIISLITRNLVLEA